MCPLDCGTCNKKVSQTGIPIKCSNCNLLYHQKCCLISNFSFKKLLEKDLDWFCELCNDDTFPFSNVSQDFTDLFKDSDPDQIKPTKKSKCNYCLKKVKQNVTFVHCHSCTCFYHLACMNLRGNDLPLPIDWQCPQCSLKALPFSHISDENMLLGFHGLSVTDTDKLSNIPGFTIQTLLDEMPDQDFSTDDFLSNSIESKYYTPAKFLSEKFSSKSFSLIHLNISSLQRHIDELVTLLSLLNHSFDVICVTETRLHGDPLVNVNIDGYDFVHTPTPSQCGGVGIFVKNTIEYEIMKSLTLSQLNVFESIFH